MAGKRDSAGKRIRDGLRFWLIVAILCGIAGVGAYQFGKHYVGARLHEMEVKQRAPEIVPQTGTASVAGDESDEPPVKPVVIMTEREPTAREERRARREITEPQDGAQLHEAEAEDEPTARDEDEDEQAPTEEPAAETPEPSGGAFTVVAGSFADPTNAQRQVERLAQRGYQAYTSTVERDGITYRRVHVGAYGSRGEAEEVRDRLRSQGFDATVTGG